jgi:hypothetical protein
MFLIEIQVHNSRTILMLKFIRLQKMIYAFHNSTLIGIKKLDI